MSDKGYIVYKLSAPHECIIKKPVTFGIEDEDKQIKALLTLSDSEELLLRIEGEHLSQKSRRVTDLLARRVMQWFAVVRGMQYLSPVVCEDSLPKDPVQWGPWSETWSFSTAASPELSLSDGHILAAHLKPEHVLTNVLFDMFGLAEEQQSPIAQFILLYNILMFIKKNSQEKIDRLIWDLAPSEVQVERARWDKPGTRFTKLRNDIGHPRRTDRAEMDRLVSDIRSALPDLRRVVCKAINGHTSCTPAGRTKSSI